jgi:hypothetical protein
MAKFNNGTTKEELSLVLSWFHAWTPPATLPPACCFTSQAFLRFSVPMRHLQIIIASHKLVRVVQRRDSCVYWSNYERMYLVYIGMIKREKTHKLVWVVQRKDSGVYWNTIELREKILV